MGYTNRNKECYALSLYKVYKLKGHTYTPVYRWKNCIARGRTNLLILYSALIFVGTCIVHVESFKLSCAFFSLFVYNSHWYLVLKSTYLFLEENDCIVIRGLLTPDIRTHPSMYCIFVSSAVWALFFSCSTPPCLRRWVRRYVWSRACICTSCKHSCRLIWSVLVPVEVRGWHVLN